MKKGRTIRPFFIVCGPAVNMIFGRPDVLPVHPRFLIMLAAAFGLRSLEDIKFQAYAAGFAAVDDDGRAKVWIKPPVCRAPVSFPFRIFLSYVCFSFYWQDTIKVHKVSKEKGIPINSCKIKNRKTSKYLSCNHNY